jgi:hypothetical protein
MSRIFRILQDFCSIGYFFLKRNEEVGDRALIWHIKLLKTEKNRKNTEGPLSQNFKR